MKAIKCEMCGSNDIVKQDGLFVCQNCGTKYSVEEAKKLMIDGTVDVKGTVKVDTSDELQNLYKLARAASIEKNTENAARYYNQILVKDPDSWEANYYAVYYKSMSCRIGEIRKAAKNVANSLPRVMRLVRTNVSDEAEQKRIVEKICVKNGEISVMLYGAATEHYKGIAESIKYEYEEEYIHNVIEIQQIMYFYGVVLEKEFKETYMSVAVDSWKLGVGIHVKLFKYLNSEAQQEQLKDLESVVEKIQEYEPTYEMPEIDYGKSDSGCYVATAVYGSYNCPEVWTLRRFRDNTLDATWYGRAFIKTYYAISPTLVKWFGNTEWFKKMWRKPLDRMVDSLRKNGVESTPYQDKY